eukprot:TRINITY_DN102560_c0_g1_i1.p1 TRINITY_DN102560_c0_g1~~TRINITY_DN102560_c0_g1_i1.p1  ORF type:complete len:223 (+),score=33.45 TRINITY_DN102560_c0_g1_i1:80-748(+)
MSRVATLLMWGLFVTAACDVHAGAPIEGRRLNTSNTSSELVLVFNLVNLDYCAGNTTLLDLVKIALAEKIAAGVECQTAHVTIQFSPGTDAYNSESTLVIATMVVPSDYKPSDYEETDVYDVEQQYDLISGHFGSSVSHGVLQKVAGLHEDFSLGGISKGASTTTAAACSDSTTSTTSSGPTTASSAAGGNGTAKVAMASAADAPRTPWLLVFAVGLLTTAQ